MMANINSPSSTLFLHNKSTMQRYFFFLYLIRDYGEIEFESLFKTKCSKNNNKHFVQAVQMFGVCRSMGVLLVVFLIRSILLCSGAKININYLIRPLVTPILSSHVVYK